MQMRRRAPWGEEEDRGRWPALASVGFHLLLVGAVVVAEGLPAAEARPPRMRVYAVNIVSPPPNVRGEPPAESPAPAAAATAEPVPAPPAPAPAPPEPPAPEPPKATPPAPAAVPTPARRPPAERPTPRETPPAGRTQPTTGRTAPSNAGSAERPSTGTGTRGQATGRDPDPNSPGGEGLSIQQAGMECPSPGYCENIVRQVRRYFRRPEGSNGSAEACFRILRDGSVDNIEVGRVRGGFAFRLAVTEAVEQAGMRKAFGALPGAFNAATLPVCVDISPQL